MSSSYLPGAPHTTDVERAPSTTSIRASQPAIIALLGRILLSLIFILSSFSLFSGASVKPAADAGVPFAAVAVPVAGAFALIGGLSVLFGFYARVGAWLLIVFLVPVTLFLHNFWSVHDPQLRQMQQVNFMKNTAMLGGVLLVAWFGAGPLSFDRRR